MAESGTNRIRILHVSDFHTGISQMGDRYILAKPHEPGRIGRIIGEGLDQFDDMQPFDFIVITGDLIDAGDCKPSEISARYALAIAEIRSIMDSVGISDVNEVIVVPGNQDVVRSTDRDAGCNADGFRLYLDFLRDFYGSSNSRMGFAVSPQETIVRNGQTRLEYKLERTEWCIQTDKHVVFWPLFTASLNVKENRDGRLTDHEIQSGTYHVRELRKVEDAGDDICIVVAHHNFFPMGPDRKPRDEREVSGSVTYGCPENSMIRLQTLFHAKVDIVLHGHRHYDFILSGEWDTEEPAVERTGIIVGCPSSGYYEGETVQPSEHGRAGFRVLDIVKTKARARVFVKRYGLYYDETWRCSRTCRDMNLRRVRGFNEFMEFDEGYGKFVSETLCPPIKSSSRRVNIFHYHNDTRWADAYRNFWGLNASNTHLIQQSLTDTWFREIQGWRQWLNEDYLPPDLGTQVLINRLDQVVHRTLTFAPPPPQEDAFERHLRKMVKDGGESARSVAYVAEALLCAAYPNCQVIKHVYICPRNVDDPAGVQERIEKFRWLCQSVLMVRKLRNFDITWLPYAIRGYRGKSLIGIRTETDTVASDVYYLGFDARPDVYSVLRLPNQEESMASLEGPVLADLRAVIAKVIHPLSDRLVHDFPLLRHGELYPEHLQALAAGIGCLNVWGNEYKERFEGAFDTTQIHTGIHADEIKRKLKGLYEWVSRTPGNGPHIPWEAADREALEKHLDGK